MKPAATVSAPTWCRLLVLAGALLAAGCVERRLTVTSTPSGALVYMNDKEIGRTPIETDFVYYGKYDIQVRKEGYETIDKPKSLNAPWWQIPPIDFFAELAPWHPTDRKSLHYTLTTRSSEDVPPEQLVARALELRPQLEGTRVPSTAPAATQPATQPSTQPVTRPAA